MNQLNTCQKLTKKVYEQIKITKILGLKIVSVSPNYVILIVPIKPNLNHKKTAFGGSVHSSALVGCWALINFYSSIKNMSPDNLVGQDSKVSFYKPIVSDFKIKTSWISLDEKKSFINSLKKYKKGRVTLISKIYCKKKLCAQAESRFVLFC